MKFRCPNCHCGYRTSSDPPMTNGVYDLFCPGHGRIRFDGNHNLIEYNLHQDTYSLGGYTKDGSYDYSGLPLNVSNKDETFLFKEIEDKSKPQTRVRIFALPFFVSFSTQEDLDSLWPKMLNMVIFS